MSGNIFCDTTEDKHEHRLHGFFFFTSKQLLHRFVFSFRASERGRWFGAALPNRNLQSGLEPVASPTQDEAAVTLGWTEASPRPRTEGGNTRDMYGSTKATEVFIDKEFYRFEIREPMIISARFICSPPRPAPGCPCRCWAADTGWVWCDRSLRGRTLWCICRPTFRSSSSTKVQSIRFHTVECKTFKRGLKFSFTEV